MATLIPGLRQTMIQITPDSWLPAVSVYGQKANLYDEDWKIALGKDYDAVQKLFSGDDPQ